MVTRTARCAVVQQGTRRLNPLRDLGQVADVIEEGFGPDLTQVGRRALKEMRFLSRLGPLLWWLMATSPDFREYHSGFVWLEEGRVVGTLHVTRPRAHARRWLISNVAVRASYRRRGIARALMEAALDWAREQGGEAVFLRVRRDNAAAWSLYDSLGFQPLLDAVDLRLAKVPPVEKVEIADPRVLLSPYKPCQYEQVRDLARLAIPPNLRWLEVTNIADFQVGLNRRLAEWWADFTTGRKTWRLIAKYGEQVAAAMVLKVAGYRGNHFLVLHVHPDHRGKVEEMLVTEALARLWPHRDQVTFATLPVCYDEILDVVRKYGFVKQHALTLMRRSLGAF